MLAGNTLIVKINRLHCYGIKRYILHVTKQFKVYLVTGGYNSGNTATTETFKTGTDAWIEVGSLQ